MKAPLGLRLLMTQESIDSPLYVPGRWFTDETGYMVYTAVHLLILLSLSSKRAKSKAPKNTE